MGSSELNVMLSRSLVQRVNAYHKAKMLSYTSRGPGCGKYSELIFVESKVLKQAHSWLRNCFSSVAIGKNSAARNPQS